MGTDVATRPDARPMPKPTKAMAEQMYDAILNGSVLPQVGDPEIASRMILEELIASDNPDRVFQAQTLQSWQEFLGDEPVIVHSFHTNPSKFEGGSSAYAVVEVEYPDSQGELRRELVTVGGQKVLVQLVKAWENGWLPLKCRLVSKETSTPGRSILGLELVS